MENADKVQEVSEESEAPEKVQQEAESSEKKEEDAVEDNVPEEVEKAEDSADTGETSSVAPPEEDPGEEREVDEHPEVKKVEDGEDATKESTTPDSENTPEEATKDIVEEKEEKGSEKTEDLVDSDEKSSAATAKEEASGEDEHAKVAKVEDAADLENSQEEEKTQKKEKKQKDTVAEDKSKKSKKSEDSSKPDEESDTSEAEAEVDHDHEEEEEDLDFEKATKDELLQKIREVSKDERIRRVDRVIKALKPRFDVLYDEEKTKALKKFEKEGNDPEAFEYHGDEAEKEFLVIYNDLRTKRNRFYKDLESQKEDNLKKKQHLLEQLRELVDGEESTASFNKVKDLQGEWKKTGPVPGAYNKTLWANYNALLDRFYDQRSIYFELKDLDRKKNLKVKEELCERAEALAKEDDLKTAIAHLNELHDEYKHAGPVPREEQEALWQRFKAASDAVYAKRKDYFDHLKEEFEENLGKKQELANEAETFSNFDSDRITDWNGKTKEIQELQKKWESIGGLPRDKAKAVNKLFWGSFKTFFNHKNQFFKRLESMRDENLTKKEELVQQAEELKDSDDWNGTTQKFKDLQAQWKDIGPVPEKVRNEVYKKFKTACDHFFDRRRAQNSEQDKAYEENLQLKLQICDRIEAIAAQDEINLDDIYDLVDNHAQIGFVPRNAIKKSQARFTESTQKILSLEDLEEGDKADLKAHIETSRLRSSPGGDKKIQRREHSMRRKISELENDISTWNTNMEFFAASATADKLKADLQEKINAAQSEVDNLKSQLSSLSS